VERREVISETINLRNAKSCQKRRAIAAGGAEDEEKTKRLNRMMSATGLYQSMDYFKAKCNSESSQEAMRYCGPKNPRDHAHIRFQCV
jgi:hypothetical protein